MNAYKNRQILVICLFIITIWIIIVNNWYGEYNLIYFWDASFPIDPSSSLERLKYPWIELNGGAYSPSYSLFYKTLILQIIKYITGDQFQKAFYTILLSISNIITFFLISSLIKRIHKQADNKYVHLVAFTASLLYMINMYNILYTYIYYQWLMLAQLGIPLLFYGLLKINSIKGLTSIYIAIILIMLSPIKVWVSIPIVLLVGFLTAINTLDKKKLLINIIKITLITTLAVLTIAPVLIQLLPFIIFQPQSITATYGASVYESYINLYYNKHVNNTIINILSESAYPHYASLIFQEKNIRPDVKDELIGTILHVIIFSSLLIMFYTNKEIEKRQYLLMISAYIFVILLLFIPLVKPLANIYAMIIPRLPFIYDIWVSYGILFTLFRAIVIGITLYIYILMLRKSGKSALNNIGKMLLLIIFISFILFSSLKPLTIIFTGMFLPEEAKIDLNTLYLYSNNILNRIMDLEDHIEDLRIALYPMVPTLVYVKNDQLNIEYLANYAENWLYNVDLISSYTDISKDNILIRILRENYGLISMWYWKELMGMGYITKEVTYKIPRIPAFFDLNRLYLKDDMIFANFKFYVVEPCLVNITIVGNPVGLVDMLLFKLNKTKVYESKYILPKTYYNTSKAEVIFFVEENTIIEPRTYINSSVNYLYIGCSDSVIKPYGFQYLRMFQILGVDYIVLRTDVIRGHPELPYPEPAYEEIKSFFDVLFNLRYEYSGAFVYSVPNSYDLVYIPERIVIVDSLEGKIQYGEYFVPKVLYVFSALTIDDKNYYLIIESNSIDDSVLNLINSSINVANARVLSFEKVSPVEWRVRVEASGPYILAFLQNYDVNWKARIVYDNGTVISLPDENHFKVNGFANGWLISSKGEYTIIIYYGFFDWVKMSFILALIGLLSFKAILLLQFKRGLRRD